VFPAPPPLNAPPAGEKPPVFPAPPLLNVPPADREPPVSIAPVPAKLEPPTEDPPLPLELPEQAARSPNATTNIGCSTRADFLIDLPFPRSAGMQFCHLLAAHMSTKMF
jgi:hypothetical protein